MIGSTLMTHRGAQRITRDELSTLPIPETTDTWKPIAHHHLIETLEEELSRRSMKIQREAYAVQRDGALLFGVLDLAYMETDEFAASIGLRTANDKSMSLQIACGLRIFVCDNMCFSGDMIALKRKHTKRLDLVWELRGAIDRYQTGVTSLKDDVDRLKVTDVTDEQAKLMLYEVFAQGIMPARFLRPVASSYFNSTEEHVDRSLWALHNACTSSVHDMAPNSAFNSTVKLGKLFGLTRQGRSAAMSLN